MNSNLNLTANFTPVPPISSQELSAALDHLEKFISNYKQGSRDDFPNINKYFAIKVMYELGYYYFLLSSYKSSNSDENIKLYTNNYQNYFTSSLEFLNNLININNINSNDKGENSYEFTYFDKESLKLVLESNSNSKVFDFQIESSISTENKDVIMVEDSNIINAKYKLNDPQDLKELIEKMGNISHQDKQIMENLTIDDNKTLELFTPDELIKYSKNMILIAMNDYSKLIYTHMYIKSVEQYCKNNEKRNVNSDDPEFKFKLKNLELENYFHLALTSVIDLIYKREDKLQNLNFLKNLSKYIITNSLTNDLEISGLLHGSLLNFTSNFSSISKYFSDFVEYFNNDTEKNNISKVNQIKFINIFIKINEAVKNVNTCTVEGNMLVEIINLICYWFNIQKEGRITIKENIMCIMIKTIKNTDFLNNLKIILIEFIKFISEKKTLKKTEDDIYDHLFSINSNVFKINTLLKDKTISFKEDNNKNQKYEFDSNNIDYFEQEAFKLVNKIEKKIIKFSKFKEVEVYYRRANLAFFQKNYEIALNDLSSYFISYFDTFKQKFYTVDLFDDLEKVNALYNEFKTLLDDTILYRLSYSFYFMKKPIEAAIILQYTKKVQYDLVYKYLNIGSGFHKVEKLEFIWKMTYFEYLSSIYHKQNKTLHLNTIMELIKRTSNHQYFKKHNLRKSFKIINFLKFLDSIKQ